MFEVLLYPSESGELEINTMQKEGHTLFLLADVVRVISKESRHIDGTNSSDQSSLLKESISALDHDENHIESYIENGQEKTGHFVTEPGIYRVVSRAKSSGAKKFQRWVYHDVMPSIRKYGIYPAPEVSDDDLIQQLADQQAKQSQLLSQFIRSSKQRFDNIDNRVDSNTVVIEKHNKSISTLSEKLVQIETKNLPKLEYFDVADVLQSVGVCTSQLTYVIALCEKIVSENGYNFIPSHSGTREEQRFSKNVIELALTYARLA
ncbi:antirepressor [Vibrio tasmaniensis]|nr:antirepressor [Vibrio tasmaniensis]